MQIFKYLLFLRTIVIFSSSQIILLEKDKYIPLIGNIDKELTNEFIKKI
jgi:hypothetical protein